MKKMKFFSFLQSFNRIELALFPILQDAFLYAFLQPLEGDGVLKTEDVAAAFSFAVLTSLFCIKIVRMLVSFINGKKSSIGD